MTRVRDGGFTLVEILVALVIGGLAVASAAAVFAASFDLAEHLRVRALGHTREQNAHRWISHVLAGMQVSNSPEGRFDGRRDGLSFQTSFWVPAGWLEEGRASLRIADRRLWGSVEGQRDVLLYDSLVGASVDYLLQQGSSSTWTSSWQSAAARPVAVRLRLARATRTDTLLHLVGVGEAR